MTSVENLLCNRYSVWTRSMDKKNENQLLEANSPPGLSDIIYIKYLIESLVPNK